MAKKIGGGTCTRQILSDLAKGPFNGKPFKLFGTDAKGKRQVFSIGPKAADREITKTANGVSAEAQ